MKQTIELSDLRDFEKEIEDPSFPALSRAIKNQGLNALAMDESLKSNNPSVFTLTVPSPSVPNQKQSGRCWMFAGFNIIRNAVAKALGISDFKVSHVYLQFYDKLEKANFFLEKMMERLDRDFEDPEVIFLLEKSIVDGGHFVMFTNLVNKYGFLPEGAMRATRYSDNTAELNSYLAKILAAGYLSLRKAHKAGKGEIALRSIKKKVLGNVYRVLCLTLGVPPKSFHAEFIGKDNQPIEVDSTPLEFYEKYAKEELNSYITLGSFPMEGIAPFAKITAPLVNNMLDGDPVIYFNSGVKEMKKALKKELQEGRCVWFSADSRSQSDRSDGFFLDRLYKIDELTGVKAPLNKGERLATRVSTCAHAMVIVGIAEKGGKIIRYKVLNSWGTAVGEQGYFTMDEGWFNEYVYQVFVKKTSVSPEVLEAYESAPVEELGPFNTLW